MIVMRVVVLVRGREEEMGYEADDIHKPEITGKIKAINHVAESRIQLSQFPRPRMLAPHRVLEDGCNNTSAAFLANVAAALGLPVRYGVLNVGAAMQSAGHYCAVLQQRPMPHSHILVQNYSHEYEIGREGGGTHGTHLRV